MVDDNYEPPIPEELMKWMQKTKQERVIYIVA